MTPGKLLNLPAGKVLKSLGKLPVGSPSSIYVKFEAKPFLISAEPYPLSLSVLKSGVFRATVVQACQTVQARGDEAAFPLPPLSLFLLATAYC